MVFDDDAEAEWRTFLENGKPAKQAQLSHGTTKVASGVELYYEVYQIHFGAAPPSDTQAAVQPPPQQQQQQQEGGVCGPPEGPIERMLLIMGFGAQANAWLPLLHQMLRHSRKAASSAASCTLQACIFDNRGIGRSSVPHSKKSYTTEAMAADAYGLLTHLRWPSAHIVGFSMGGMIATKLAAMQPQCVTTLTLISVTSGGWEILPAVGTVAAAVFKGGLFDKSNRGRALTDIKFHFSRGTRHTRLGTRTIGEILVEEYLRTQEEDGLQPPEGEQGHFNACWTHRVTEGDVQRIIQRG